MVGVCSSWVYRTYIITKQNSFDYISSSCLNSFLCFPFTVNILKRVFTRSIISLLLDFWLFTPLKWLFSNHQHFPHYQTQALLLCLPPFLSQSDILNNSLLSLLGLLSAILLISARITVDSMQFPSLVPSLPVL